MINLKRDLTTNLIEVWYFIERKVVDLGRAEEEIIVFD